MQTIYWLSAFGMVLCYALFIRSLAYAYGTYRSYKHIPAIVKFGIEMQGGVWCMVEYKHLIVAIISTIVFVTI